MRQRHCERLQMLTIRIKFLSSCSISRHSFADVAAIYAFHPFRSSPKENWHRYETEALRTLADARDVRFVDYNELFYNDALELDLAADFRDDEHLNHHHNHIHSK